MARRSIGIWLCAIGLAAAACSADAGESKDPKATLRRDAQQVVLGTWVGDLDRIAELVPADKDEDERMRALFVLRRTYGNTRHVISEDRWIVGSTSDVVTPTSYAYEVKSRDGDRWTIHSTSEQDEQTFVAHPHGDSLDIYLDGKLEEVLKRAPADEGP